MTPPRPSLFRCRKCGRTLTATPNEVRVCVRALWPRCCKLDMALFIAAPRPGAHDTDVAAPPVPLPATGPDAGTAELPSLPTPPPHRPLC